MSAKILFIAKNRADRRRYARMSELIDSIYPILETGTLDEIFALDDKITKSEMTDDEVIQFNRLLLATRDRIESKTLWTIYWLDGSRNVIAGESIEVAFNKAGYGGGSIKAVDLYMPGDNRDYRWIKPEGSKNGKWVLKSSIH